MKPRTLLAISFELAVALSAAAQTHVVAYVPTSEAESTNVLTRSGNMSLLGPDSVIHASDDRPAHITLARGGAILVCQSSKVHLTEAERISFQGEKSNLIGLSLDSGALEIRMPLSVGDTLVTPDLRFTSGHFKPANLDLAMGLHPNGDTCVENRGKDAPWLNITDTSGQTSYRLRPKQHIQFEQASLKDVVDIDNNTCGCPSLLPPAMTLADALLNGSPGAPTKPPTTPPVDEAALAFPTDDSQGLTSAPGVIPVETPGERHIQIAATLSYDPSAPNPIFASTPLPASALHTDPARAIPRPAPKPVIPTAPPPAIVAHIQPSPTPQPDTKSKRSTVSGFFHKLFGRD